MLISNLLKKSCKRFPPITFLGEFFARFSAELNSALNVAFYDTHIECEKFGCLYVHFLLVLQPTSDETAEKNEKKYFINMS